jgi:hypothetical protein
MNEERENKAIISESGGRSVTGKGRITSREKSIEWKHGEVRESRGEFGGDRGP